MTPADHGELATGRLHAIAWKFLGSEFAGPIYANWPIDRRVEACLLHNGFKDVVNDGGACNAVLQCVMANIGRALRDGRLSPPQDRYDPDGSRPQGAPPRMAAHEVATYDDGRAA
ncbi:hypothetical protein [Mycolicibacterium chlorophenolicum]|uniref:Uncharacterized protein n=1 Tax=Mycolicibacterium chlorophenolicum TaxID=37916 RepID=A0A0J6VJX7_9MYCO|nr:hypothetical protein [Mycolicibacterium chlorophenolicum]KMO71310.1 hypothetical protein MCHLDSM_04625 [Mycolicibacterium chlorophenolicum]